MGAVTKFTADEQQSLKQKRTIPRLVSLPLAGIGMLAVGLGVGADNMWIAAALAVFTASMMFCWTSALHEASHQTLWHSQRACIWSGRILGTLMFTPYTVYREVHIRHHAYLNTPRDWELWPYSDPKASLRFRRMFVWFDLLAPVVAGPFVYGRIFFRRNSPIKDPAIRRSIRNEYWAILVVWCSIWVYTTVTQQWPEHVRAILLPMYLAALLQTGRKFTEHLGMSSFDPMRGTRTVVPRKWVLRLSSFMNFDIFVHGPHHRHPRLIHTSLESKLDEYRIDNPRAKYPAYDRYWKATLAMLPYLFRNPGCGVNVGGKISATDKERKEVDDFVTDVVAQGYAQEELSERVPAPLASQPTSQGSAGTEYATSQATS